MLVGTQHRVCYDKNKTNKNKTNKNKTNKKRTNKNKTNKKRINKNKTNKKRINKQHAMTGEVNDLYLCSKYALPMAMFPCNTPSSRAASPVGAISTIPVLIGVQF